MPPASLPDAPWYKHAFDRTWLRIYAHRDDASADAEAGAVVERLGLGVGHSILDVGCGSGRHARGFARRGLLVTGVDLSRAMLDVAREKSPHLPGKPNYLRWDARKLPFRGQFDAAVSMFTSIGYTRSPRDDYDTFCGVARALKRGGHYLLDFLNEAQVRANLVAEDEKSIDTLRVTFRRRIAEHTTGGPMVIKDVEAVDARSGRVETSFQERVRLYTREDIDRLLRDAGLEPEGEPLGDVFGAPFSESAERLVRIARCP